MLDDAVAACVPSLPGADTSPGPVAAARTDVAQLVAVLQEINRAVDAPVDVG